MNTETYITYLEDIVLSLFSEKNREFTLKMKSKNPSFDGFFFSSVNAKEEINRQRNARLNHEN